MTRTSTLGGGGSTIIPGVPPPGVVTDWFVTPDGTLFDSALTVTTTINRLYYIPVFHPLTHTFQGAATYNSGTGDNGETLRIGIYSHGSAGPTTLIKDFGEITLTGASAQRLLSSSVSIPGGLWYWWCIHHATACDMYAMVTSKAASAAGYFNGKTIRVINTDFGIPDGAFLNSRGSMAVYVDTTYGALASTAVAPTASITTASAGLPIIALKA